MAAEIVSRTAERLVREEIDRIKAGLGSRSDAVGSFGTDAVGSCGTDADGSSGTDAAGSFVELTRVGSLGTDGCRFALCALAAERVARLTIRRRRRHSAWRLGQSSSQRAGDPAR